MSKVTLNSIGNVGGNPNAVAQVLNANFALITAAFERCLFKDGTPPNQMEADLDLNDQVLDNVTIGSEVVIEE